MGERETVERVAEPVTVSSIASDLRVLGVSGGDTLLVHSSLSALGWVSGGPQAVVKALQEVLTESGTLVMPAFTSQCSDPSVWSNPPVPEEWVETIVETRPPFQPGVTPTRGVGAVPECFRSVPDVYRSDHPEYSFAAWGAGAETITADHGFDNGLGENSPLARIYDRGGDVLFLGTDHNTNTSLHLAEHRAEISTERTTNAVSVIEDGECVSIEYADIETSTHDFPALGGDFERRVGCATGTVGTAQARLIDQRDLVDFAVEWFEANR